MVDQEKIGRYVAERRREMRMTQNELAERLGVSGQAVSKWERGECLPDTGLLLELAAILCTSVDGLRGEERPCCLFAGKSGRRIFWRGSPPSSRFPA